MNLGDFRIEETWRLWCKFLDDYSRFEDWLKTAELTAANPESSNVLYTSAKEELKKYEVRRRFSLSLSFVSGPKTFCRPKCLSTMFLVVNPVDLD